MYVVHDLHVESWLMLPQAHSQGKFTPAGAPNMFGVGMSAGPALKALNSGWQVRRIRAVSTRVRLHVLSGLGVHDTGIQEERVHFFRGKCERPFTFAGREYVPLQHRGELDRTKTIQWHLG
jgi:hypothetical protein